MVRPSNLKNNGKITLVATILMLALATLAGLLGNAGHAVNQKISTQNAADSVAFSSALWLARGMNAVTATNHLVGETTGMVAVHEALGGPEFDVGLKLNTTENQLLDRTINGVKATAPIGSPVPSPFGYTPKPVRDIDRRIVEFVTKRTSPNDDRMQAFAAIYDSRMTLQRELAILLSVKSFADLGFFVPPPWGYATAAAAYVVHLAATSQIVLIGKEWIVLEVLEASAKQFKPAKRIMERQLVPTLAAHGDWVAGLEAASSAPAEGIVNAAIERALQELVGSLQVEAATFPQTEKLRLPVEPEPQPNLQGTSSEATDGWGTDEPVGAGVTTPEFGTFRRRLSQAQDKMRERVSQLSKRVADLEDDEVELKERLEKGSIPDEEAAELREEIEAIRKSRVEKSAELADLVDQQRQLDEQQTRLEQALNPPLPTQSQNPSLKSVPFRMDQDQERATQWVRATYPYVDSFRAPLRSWLEKWAPKSQAASHFTKWSNRYTLIKAWQFRSGYRFKKSGNGGSWEKTEEPLHLLVLRDSFLADESRKGREPWVGRGAADQELAGEYFTLLGIAHRDYQTLFSPAVYPAVNEKGLTAYAQAILYNANPQRPDSGDSLRQPQLGWDTLNWDPNGRVPEWGASPADGTATWPWEIFDISGSQATLRVRLNWQAKLVPVTTARLQAAGASLSGAMQDNVSYAATYQDVLGTH